MTVWDAPVVAEIARQAGFGRDDAITATALALTVSGGNENYRYTIGGGAYGDWRGLLGIDVARFPVLADSALYHASSNMHAAKWLCDCFDGWWWSAPYRTKAYAQHLPEAATANSNVTYRQTVQMDNMVGTWHNHAQAQIDNMAHARRERATQWQAIIGSLSNAK